MKIKLIPKLNKKYFKRLCMTITDNLKKNLDKTNET